jgi:hypothetical protein
MQSGVGMQIPLTIFKLGKCDEYKELIDGSFHPIQAWFPQACFQWQQLNAFAGWPTSCPFFC